MKKIIKTQHYSFSLISAVSQDAILANQLIEGGVDSSVFENFVFNLLDYVRKEERYRGRHIVLLMDNATIHKHPRVVDTIIKMKFILLYNP
jgi:transposase